MLRKSWVPDYKRSKCRQIRIHVRVTGPDAYVTKTKRHAVLPAKHVCVTRNDRNSATFNIQKAKLIITTSNIKYFEAPTQATQDSFSNGKIKVTI